MKKLVMLSVIMLMAGCGLMFTGTHDSVSFSSDPMDAEVYINGQLRGKTPMVLKLKSDEEYSIKIDRGAPYEPRYFTITNTLGGGYVFLDIIGFGLLGLIVDGASGGWYTLDQELIHAQFEASESFKDKQLEWEKYNGIYEKKKEKK